MHIEKGYVNGPAGLIHYRAAGSGDTRLVLFHPTPVSSTVFEPLIRAAAERFRVIAFDTPGYGQSDPPPNRLTIAELADRLLPAVQAHVGGGRAVMCGSHTGACIALEMAANAGRGMADGLALIELPMIPDGLREHFLRTWAPPLDPDDDGQYLNRVRERYFESSRRDRPLELRHLQVSELVAHVDRYSWGYDSAFSYDPRPALGRVSCPTLFLRGMHETLDIEQELPTVSAPFRDVTLDTPPGEISWTSPQKLLAELTEFFPGLGEGR